MNIGKGLLMLSVVLFSCNKEVMQEAKRADASSSQNAKSIIRVKDLYTQ